MVIFIPPVYCTEEGLTSPFVRATQVWRKEHLRKHIIENESPHEVELAGTTRVSHDQDVIVLGTRQWPCKHTLAFRARDSQKLLLSDIAKPDVEEMTALGLLKPWGVE